MKCPSIFCSNAHFHKFEKHIIFVQIFFQDVLSMNTFHRVRLKLVQRFCPGVVQKNITSKQVGESSQFQVITMTTSIKLPGGATMIMTSTETSWSGSESQVTEGKALMKKRFKQVIGSEPFFTEKDVKALNEINISEFDVKSLFMDGWSEENIRTIVTEPSLYPDLEKMQFDLLKQSGIPLDLLKSWKVNTELNFQGKKWLRPNRFCIMEVDD